MFTIVVPLDGSRLAEEVLPRVEDLASRLHANLHLLQVLDVPIRVAAARAEDLPGNVLATNEVQLEQSRQEAGEYLTNLASALREKGLDASWEATEGRAATKIVEVAHSHSADLIAMSTHGRSGLGQLVFGSVANEVLRNAGIPVLLVRPTHKKLGDSHAL